MTNDAAERGRQAFVRREWRVAYEQLSIAHGAARLAPTEIEQLATAAYLTGHDAEAITLWKSLHHSLAEKGQCESAARIGFWVAFMQLLRGESAQSRGWIGRTQRLLDTRPDGCVEQGYILALEALQSMGAGDSATADATFGHAIGLADRFGDIDLLSLGLLGRGQALLLLGECARGIAMLDEAMVAVIADEVSPILSGILYCASISTCHGIFDVRRAREWTVALVEWCATQPQSMPFRGECLVHRSEILQLQGEWASARDEAERACEWLSARTQRLAGRAFYLRGELHRLRGELELAEDMYREAVRNDYEPQPGVSLLRLAQGQLGAAAAAIRRVVAEARDLQDRDAATARPGVLGACVEIMLAVDVAAARAAAEELVAIASVREAPFLRAVAAQAMGSVLLEEGDANPALRLLRESWTTWQQLEAPYESARVRVLIARACEQLGDRDTARLHFGAAATVFERLGASPDAARLERIASKPASPGTLLTERELEVLVLVASGKTNRQIASRLAISEHTVARHLSNIYNKLGVATRTAASAYAYEHHLVGRG